jgi:hypothetical protein
VVIMGGHGPGYNHNDVWTLDATAVTTATWQQRANAAWEPRSSLAAAVLADTLIVTGGQLYSSLGGGGETWRLSDWSGVWTQITPSYSPARQEHSMAIWNNQLLLTAGWLDASKWNDCWLLNNSTWSWNSCAQPSGFSPRGAAIMQVYMGRLFIMTGFGSGVQYNDVLATAAPPTTSPTSSSSSSSSSSTGDSEPLAGSDNDASSASSVPLIAGAVSGTAGLVALLLLICWFVRRKRKAADDSSRAAAADAVPAAGELQLVSASSRAVVDNTLSPAPVCSLEDPPRDEVQQLPPASGDALDLVGPKSPASNSGSSSNSDAVAVTVTSGSAALSPIRLSPDAVSRAEMTRQADAQNVKAGGQLATAALVAGMLSDAASAVFPPFGVVFSVLSKMAALASQAECNATNCRFLSDRCQVLGPVLKSLEAHWLSVEARGRSGDIEASAHVRAALPSFERMVAEFESTLRLLQSIGEQSRFRRWVHSGSTKEAIEQQERRLTTVLVDLQLGISEESRRQTNQILDTLRSAAPYVDEKLDAVLAQLERMQEQSAVTAAAALQAVPSATNALEAKVDAVLEQLPPARQDADILRALASIQGHMMSMKRVGLARERQFAQQAKLLHTLEAAQERRVLSGASVTRSPLPSQLNSQQVAMASAASATSNSGNANSGSVQVRIHQSTPSSSSSSSLMASASRGVSQRVPSRSAADVRVDVDVLELAANRVGGGGSGLVSPSGGGTTLSPPAALSPLSPARLHARSFTDIVGRSFEIDASEVEIGEEVGRGTFGAVYRATYRGQTVAVKKLIGIRETGQEEVRQEDRGGDGGT